MNTLRSRIREADNVSDEDGDADEQGEWDLISKCKFLDEFPTCPDDSTG